MKSKYSSSQPSKISHADEKNHPKSQLEWWSFESFFTEKQARRWALKLSLIEINWIKEIGLDVSLFDQTGYQLFCLNDFKKIVSRNSYHYLAQYNGTFIGGNYPDYSLQYNDWIHDIIINLNFKADTSLQWVSEKITNGWLPMGLGFYRYGFIPRGTITGTLKKDNQVVEITGTGYFEHIWGNFKYIQPWTNITHVPKSISIYSRLFFWWMQNHKFHIPSKLTFSTDNNPLGYDWIWVVFKNKWSMFYGNVPFWLTQGPATGVLYIQTDDKKIYEFETIEYSYLQTKYSQHFDCYYPTEIVITARNKEQYLYLTCKSTSETWEKIIDLSKQYFWIAFILCEAIGDVNGYILDKGKRVDLCGTGKIESQRQISKFGHNQLSIQFLKPPKGIGFLIQFHSHFLKRELCVRIDFVTKPHIFFSLKKITLRSD